MAHTRWMMEPIRFGKFLLVEQIAAGGMAEIYKAVGVTVGGQPQILAIKRILPQYSNDQEFISLLVDEAKLMVFLNHPNIVPIIEFGKVEDSYYIAMDYVEGTTLKGLFRRVREQNQQFTIDMACHIVREIGSGLAYAHRKTDRAGKPMEIVHRDISPANILCSFDGDVKIADFGISKAATQGHRTQIGVIRGKTGYMSPEQTRSGAPVTQQSDLYSLGIIFWELLTGDRLYSADSIPEALALIRKSEVPPPSSRRPAIPPQLDAIVLNALTSAPMDRLQKGEDLVDAINEFLGRFAPGGRPVRVTHTDLTGFLRRYFAAEMQAASSAVPIQLDEMITKVETLATKTALVPGKDKELTRPETIAQNPLFEMSEPEYAVSKESQVTAPSGSTAEETVPDAAVSLINAPAGFVKRARRIPPIVWTVGLVMLFVALLVYRLMPGKGSFDTSAKGKVLVAVQSDPPGAEILVDDQSTNRKTPADVEVPLRRNGNVKITVSKLGFLNETREIAPKGSGMWPISFKLAEDKSQKGQLGVVSLVTQPKGARVFLDGTPVDGMTPLELSIQPKTSVMMRVEMDGYKPKETPVEIDEAGGRIEKVIFLQKLSPQDYQRKPKRPGPIVPALAPLGPPSKPAVARGKPATLGVRTEYPPSAEVFVDGKKVDREIPFVGVFVPIGKHRVIISPKGEKALSYQATVDFTPGRVVTCIYNFETQEGGCK